MNANKNVMEILNVPLVKNHVKLNVLILNVQWNVENHAIIVKRSVNINVFIHSVLKNVIKFVIVIPVKKNVQKNYPVDMIVLVSVEKYVLRFADKKIVKIMTRILLRFSLVMKTKRIQFLCYYKIVVIVFPIKLFSMNLKNIKTN